MKNVMSAEKRQSLVNEAKSRFKRCEEWEAMARENYLYDMKFANGDSQNLYQWSDDMVRARQSENKPCLTVNKTRQHNLQIINDQRQHPSQVSIKPVGNSATYEAAKVFEGLVRHVEYHSNAQQAYNNAAFHQVFGGIGYWRVTTDYVSEDSFDQDIFIRRIADPLSVYLDPDIAEADGSDARFGFVFRDMPRDDFKAQYGEEPGDDGEMPDPVGMSEAMSDTWETKDHVRVCEYFRKVLRADRLHELADGTTLRESEVPEGYRIVTADDVKDGEPLDEMAIMSVRDREVETPKIEWFLLGGHRVLEKKDWPGKYIPIVRCIGEETVIEGRLDRKGHTRALIDPQRIYNFWTSAAVEQVALQSKTPYIAPEEAIEGHENEWANANIENQSVLTYNGKDEAGQPIAPPQRQAPPVMADAYINGMRISANELMMVSGQYEASMGAKSNEVSGKAVDARERQGDNATFHYIDRFATAIRFTGRILIDLMPKIYDTKRVIAILGMDGSQQRVMVDPDHDQPHTQMADPDDQDFDPEAIVAIFNPNIGEYAVQADIGPEYGTLRQETFNAITQILQYNEGLTPYIADILFEAADFPFSKEIAERLRNMVPPQALGKENPQVQQLQQMLAQQHDAMQKMQSDLQAAKNQNLDLANKLITGEQQKSLDVYKAETDRMKAIGGIDPEAMKPIIRELVSEVLGHPVNAIIHAHADEASKLPQPPVQDNSTDK